MPIPYHLFIDLFVRKSTARLMVNKYTLKDEPNRALIQSIINSLDYAELRSALHLIKNYPGLSFIDIEAADGTIVKIVNT
jgi:hypothetical protein